MKVGFTPHEARKYAKGLTEETFRFFDIPMPYDLTFHVKNLGKEANHSLAVTSFMGNEWLGIEWPEEIIINPTVLPHVYEDELIGLILHEAAHAVSGIKADHGPVWAKNAAMVGGHNKVSMLIRNQIAWLRDRRMPEDYIERTRVGMGLGMYVPDYEGSLY